MNRVHLALGLAIALAAGPAWADEDISKVNGRIAAEAGRQYGDLDTVNGGIDIGDGARTREAQTVNGSIGLVDTRLKGGIETVSGDITVGVGSHVSGGIAIRKPGFSLSFKPARKPRVVIGPNAVVDGKLEFEREVTLYVHRSAKIGGVSGATAQSFDSEVAPGD